MWYITCDDFKVKIVGIRHTLDLRQKFQSEHADLELLKVWGKSDIESHNNRFNPLRYEEEQNV